jgi:hypothetical protein
MDRFQNCEKILDETLLRQEYYRELTKRKLGKNRKDATK